MRTLLTVMLFLIAPVSLLAQEETLISGDIESGGFGGPVVKFSPVNNVTSVFVGGRGGWIVNHSFILGGGGYGLASNVDARGLHVNGQQAKLTFGYGGVEMEYVAMPNKLVHYSAMLLIGGGGVGYRDSLYMDQSSEAKAVFVLEPALQVDLNVTTFMRVSIGASYRYVSGTGLAGTSAADLSGPAALLTFRFGKF